MIKFLDKQGFETFVQFLKGKTANYNVAPSSNDCRYKCKKDYHREELWSIVKKTILWKKTLWKGNLSKDTWWKANAGKCVSNRKTQEVVCKMPEIAFAELDNLSITQVSTWRIIQFDTNSYPVWWWSDWTPDNIAVYKDPNIASNPLGSKDVCTFHCVQWYHRDINENNCVSDHQTKQSNCTKPQWDKTVFNEVSHITQTRHWSCLFSWSCGWTSRSPQDSSLESVYDLASSTTKCRYKCADGYHRENNNCVSDQWVAWCAQQWAPEEHAFYIPRQVPAVWDATTHTYIPQQNCRWECDNWYHSNHDNTACVGSTETKTWSCVKPWWIETVFNTVSEISQQRLWINNTVQWGDWVPNDSMLNAEYNEEGADNACRYMCADGYHRETKDWIEQCIYDITYVSCGKIWAPEHADYIEVEVQWIWDSSEQKYLPQQNCDWSCHSGYYRIGNLCKKQLDTDTDPVSFDNDFVVLSTNKEEMEWLNEDTWYTYFWIVFSHPLDLDSILGNVKVFINRWEGFNLSDRNIITKVHGVNHEILRVGVPYAWTYWDYKIQLSSQIQDNKGNPLLCNSWQWEWCEFSFSSEKDKSDTTCDAILWTWVDPDRYASDYVSCEDYLDKVSTSSDVALLELKAQLKNIELLPEKKDILHYQLYTWNLLSFFGEKQPWILDLSQEFSHASLSDDNVCTYTCRDDVALDGHIVGSTYDAWEQQCLSNCYDERLTASSFLLDHNASADYPVSNSDMVKRYFCSDGVITDECKAPDNVENPCNEWYTPDGDTCECLPKYHEWQCILDENSPTGASWTIVNRNVSTVQHLPSLSTEPSLYMCSVAGNWVKQNVDSWNFNWYYWPGTPDAVIYDSDESPLRDDAKYSNLCTLKVDCSDQIEHWFGSHYWDNANNEFWACEIGGCEGGYHIDPTWGPGHSPICVSDFKDVMCNKEWAPAHATYIEALVEGKWDGTTYVPSEYCKWKCDTDYHQEWDICKSNTETRVTSCQIPHEAWLKANIDYNTVSEITQTRTWQASFWWHWSWSSWTPSPHAVYNAEASITECRYTCADGFHRENDECVSDTKQVPCQETWAPAHASYSSSQVLWVWNGTTYVPQENCAWNCNAGYHKADSWVVGKYWKKAQICKANICSGSKPVHTLYSPVNTILPLTNDFHRTVISFWANCGSLTAPNNICNKCVYKCIDGYDVKNGLKPENQSCAQVCDTANLGCNGDLLTPYTPNYAWVSDWATTINYICKSWPRSVDCSGTCPSGQKWDSTQKKCKEDSCFDVVNISGGVRITGYKNNLSQCWTDVVIPTRIGWKIVKAIWMNAFYNKWITSLSFQSPSYVSTIQNNAFKNNQLKDFEIPSSLTTIWSHAFSSNLWDTSLEGKVRGIRNQNIDQDVTVSDTADILIETPQKCFNFRYYSSTPPPLLFNETQNLDFIDFWYYSSYWHHDWFTLSCSRSTECDYNFDPDPNNHNNLFSNTTNPWFSTFVEFQNFHNQYKNVYAIKGYNKSIEWCDLETIVIPKYYNDLKIVWIGEWPTSWNWHDIWNTKEIYFSNFIEYIRSNAFQDRSIEKVIIPWSMKVIRQYAFASNNINRLIFLAGEGNLRIEERAFSHNQLTELSLPGRVKKVVWEGSFKHNNISVLTLGEWIEEIWYFAFLGNQLTSINTPCSMSLIYRNAFRENPWISDNGWYFKPQYYRIDVYAVSSIDIDQPTTDEPGTDKSYVLKNSLTSVPCQNLQGDYNNLGNLLP